MVLIETFELSLDTLRRDPKLQDRLYKLTLQYPSESYHERSILNTDLEEVINLVDDCSIVIGSVNKIIVGWCLLDCRDTGTKDKCWLKIYVAPRYRRQGIGKAIVAHARRVAKKPIYVTPWNNSSAGFFKNVGFTKSMRSNNPWDFKQLTEEINASENASSTTEQNASCI